MAETLRRLDVLRTLVAETLRRLEVLRTFGAETLSRLEVIYKDLKKYLNFVSLIVPPKQCFIL